MANGVATQGTWMACRMPIPTSAPMACPPTNYVCVCGGVGGEGRRGAEGDGRRQTRRLSCPGRASSVF